MPTSITDSVNATHDPALRSWVVSANTADTDFPARWQRRSITHQGGDWRGLMRNARDQECATDLIAIGDRLTRARTRFGYKFVYFCHFLQQALSDLRVSAIKPPSRAGLIQRFRQVAGRM